MGKSLTNLWLIIRALLKRTNLREIHYARRPKCDVCCLLLISKQLEDTAMYHGTPTLH